MMRLKTMNKHLGPRMMPMILGSDSRKKSFIEKQSLGSHRGLERNRPSITTSSEYCMRLEMKLLNLLHLFMAWYFSSVVGSMIGKEIEKWRKNYDANWTERRAMEEVKYIGKRKMGALLVTFIILKPLQMHYLAIFFFYVCVGVGEGSGSLFEKAFGGVISLWIPTYSPIALPLTCLVVLSLGYVVEITIEGD